VLVGEDRSEAFGVIFVAGPLGQIVIDVDNPQAVKDVAGGFERCRDPGGMTEVEERWERKPHSAALVGDQRPAAVTADLAGKDSLISFVFTVEEPQMRDPFREPYVTLVKDGCPLHRCAVQFLAGQAMTDFGVHWIRTDLVLNGATMAPCTKFRKKFGSSTEA
jgi:hypothetical protein